MTRPLKLGPIVGHTDDHSACVWIQARDSSVGYRLQVRGVGQVPFQPTSESDEFATAVAFADGLQADREYRYRVMRGDRSVPRSSGTFRTMPAAGSVGEISFVSMSCADRAEPGAWRELAAYVEHNRPHFVLMMGDQVYMDNGDDVWANHLDGPSDRRRNAMASKYHEHWTALPEIRTLMANTPIYMIWDDHEIRDGWGSWAGDSPTLAGRYPRGAPITQRYEAYFRDARELYWHFQASRNPLDQPGPLRSEPGTDRSAMPFWFDCGRLRVVVLDGRGARDGFRAELPVLGSSQWAFLEHLLGNLPPMIDALAVVTPVPIVAMAPEAISMRILRDRRDDVELYREGRAKELLELQHGLDDSEFAMIKALVAEYVPFVSRKVSGYHIGDLDDVRDQWSHPTCRPEQERLLRAAATAAFAQRPPGQPRAVLFLGGDIHAGARFSITVDQPRLVIDEVIASAISKDPPGGFESWFLIGERSFEVADGIDADLKDFVVDNNFGITRMSFTGATPTVSNVIAHPDESTSWHFTGL